MDNRKYWSGKKILGLTSTEVFVFGSNPKGVHGLGAAKTAMQYGAQYGVGRGLSGQSYALITKVLDNQAGYFEKATGITYNKTGYCSVSPAQIKANIDELYNFALQNPDKNFIITYQYETWPNGSHKKSLNGYDSKEFLQMFIRDDIPQNIVFHDSYKPFIEAGLTNSVNATVPSNVANKEPTYTYFFQATSPFSQWHPALFEYKELQFICTEQFMMYAKAKTFKDDNVASRIIHIENNFDSRDHEGKFKTKDDEDCYNLIMDFKEGRIDKTQIVSNYKTLNTWKKVQTLIKKLGREVANYDDEVWKQKRVPVVSVGNREKYNQNPDLKDILMATGDSIMVEASPYDKIWGIGLDEATAKKTPPEKWPGLNLLGLDVLTNLKTYYRSEPAPTTKMKM